MKLRPRSMDITITATARSGPLKRMLASAKTFVLTQIPPGTAYVNVDRIFGNDIFESIQAIKDVFGHDLVINTPKEPNHAAAIQWLWHRVKTPTFLHLEDDYVFVKPIPVQAVDEPVGALAFLYPELGWRGGDDLVNSNGDVAFGTSPRLLNRDFAYGYASRLNLKKCPEKQRYHNTQLHDWCMNWQCKVFHERGALMHHVGATWNKEHNITREVKGGAIRRFENGVRIT